MRFLVLLISVCSLPAWCFDPPPAWKNIDHVIVVVLENTDYEQALKQPFQTLLTSHGALLTNYFALTHPSQPNYIGLIAGDMLGVDSDANFDLNTTMLIDLLEKAGKTWKVYAEDYPGDAENCFLQSRRGLYVRKHVPFLSFKSVQNNPKKCSNIVSAQKHFTKDLAAGALPTFSFYVPNLDNDGHDTSPAFADRALQKVFAPLIAKASIMSRTLLIVTYDEDDKGAGNQVYTLLVGSSVRPGFRSSVKYNHFSLLRTIEEIFNLGTLGRYDATASPILDNIWVK